MRRPARLDRLPDDALLAAVAVGERDAAAVFVRRFQRRVYGLALSIVHDTALADDVAQTAFERAWRHAGSFDARRGAVLSWLLTITRNVAIDVVRVRRAVPVDPATVGDLVAPAGADPAMDAVRSDQVRRLRLALSGLSEEHRRAVVLATIGGRTAMEIAAAEDIPLGTAKTRIRSGLLRLRDAVAEVR